MTKDKSLESPELTFKKYSELLRSYQHVWELLHKHGYYTDLKDIFDVYGEEQKIIQLLDSLAEENPLAWAHATAISALAYLLCREMQVSIIESQEAFFSVLLKLTGLTSYGHAHARKDNPDESSLSFSYPDMLFNVGEKKRYLHLLKELISDYSGISINVLRSLEHSLDSGMLNEAEAKSARISTAHKIIIVCNDLYTQYLMLPKKLQTLSSLVTIANCQSLFRFNEVYQRLIGLFRGLPTQSERFPPGPADLASRLEKYENARSDLVSSVRKMLSIVADTKAKKKIDNEEVLSKIPYRLWLITNSSGILSNKVITPLWEDYDLLTGKVESEVEFDRASKAFSLSHALDDIELLQWLVRQYLSSHAYALNAYVLENIEQIQKKHPALLQQINTYLEDFDLSVSLGNVEKPRAPTLVEPSEQSDKTNEEFMLFNLDQKL